MFDMDFGEASDDVAVLDPAEAREAVSRALAVLTPEQREVVVLRYFNSKSHREIAQLLGKREGAVRAMLLRALRHMRKVMTDVAP
jgi:RNA polymerase sigma-70 factor (ECF subfamily)